MRPVLPSGEEGLSSPKPCLPLLPPPHLSCSPTPPIPYLVAKVEQLNHAGVGDHLSQILRSLLRQPPNLRRRSSWQLADTRVRHTDSRSPTRLVQEKLSFPPSCGKKKSFFPPSLVSPLRQIW